jgi:hypothetical protein
MQALLPFLAIAFLLPGFLAVVFPIFPGVLYMLIVAVVYGFVTNFEQVSGNWFWLFGLLALTSIIVDYTSGVLGSKFGGATKKAILWGFLGALIGTFTIPLVGSLVGLFVGIAAAELSQLRSLQQTFKAASSGVLGSLLGIVVNFLIALTFFISFIVAVF